MVAARPGKRRPPEDGVGPLGGRQRHGIERLAGPILHGPLTAELAVPDGELTVEIPETRERHQVQAVGRGGGPHRQERRHHRFMQDAGWSSDLGQVGSGPPDELIQ
jgi:hypothetical protein